MAVQIIWDPPTDNVVAMTWRQRRKGNAAQVHSEPEGTRATASPPLPLSGECTDGAPCAPHSKGERVF